MQKAILWPKQTNLELLPCCIVYGTLRFDKIHEFPLAFLLVKKSQLPILTTKNEVMLLCILVGIELHHKACHKRAANSKIHMDEECY